MLSYFSELGRKRYHLNQILKYTDDKYKSIVRNFIFLNKVSVLYKKFEVSKELMDDFSFPQIVSEKKDKKLQDQIKEVNKIIEDSAKEIAFRRIAKNNPLEKISKLIAPIIPDLDDHKKVIALQLASDKVHFYIISDIDASVVELLKYAVALQNNSIFVDLKESKRSIVSKYEDLLQKFDFIAVENFDYLKKSDRLALQSLIEKGTYMVTRSNARYKKESNTKILAHSYPLNGKFVGKSLDIIKKQIPLDKNFLSKFQIVSVVRKKEKKDFLNFKINKNDYVLVKEFYDFVKDIKVDVPKELEEKVYLYAQKIKLKQNFYITPNESVAVGLVRLAKANARLKLKSDLSEEDLITAFDLIVNVMEYKKE